MPNLHDEVELLRASKADDDLDPLPEALLALGRDAWVPNESAANDDGFDALWSRIERERVAPPAESPPLRIVASSTPSPARARAEHRALWAVAALAAAASFALFPHATEHAPARSESTTASNQESVGAEFVRALGDAVVSGVEARKGAPVALGQRTAVTGRGRAIFNSQVGKATWSLGAADGEARAEAEVTRADRALVVTLATGAVEMAVVSGVAGRDAVAIDAGATRVSAKGTRFRVERRGARLAVDVTEGVIAIGDRSSFSGRWVSAPAHIDVPADDPNQLVVSHAPAHVRPAASFEEDGAVAVVQGGTTDDGQHGPARASSPVVPSGSSAPTQPTTPGPVESPDPRERIMAAVKQCMRAHGAPVGSAQGVTVYVQSTLELQLRGDGMVQSARFNPPLQPEVQACAAEVIYQVRFESGGGRVQLPLSLK